MGRFRSIALLGDLMLEVIEHYQELPPDGKTTVLSASRAALGGAAYNIGWHLARLGHAPRVVAPVGDQQRTTVEDAFRRTCLSPTSLLAIPGGLDTLVTLTDGRTHRSIYLSIELDHDVTNRLCASASADIVVFTGSRHAEIQRAYGLLAQHEGKRIGVFAPSYALYAIEDHLLKELARKSQVVIANRDEAAWLQERFSARTPIALSKKLGLALVVTKGHEGAMLVQEGHANHIESVSGRRGEVLGAGDAFTAGITVGLSANRPLLECCRLAAALASFVVRNGDPRTIVTPTQLAERVKENFGSRVIMPDITKPELTAVKDG